MSVNKWLLACLLFCAVVARAESSHSEKLSMLDFYPHVHQFEFNLHEITTFSNQTLSSAGSVDRSASDQFYSALRYGLGDGWRLAISETILWDQTNDVTAKNGTESVTTAAGPSNPTLTVSKRWYEQEDAGLSADLSLGFTPTFGPKVNGNSTTAKTGNNSGGGAVGTLTASLYWHGQSHETVFSGAVSQSAESTTETAASGDTKASPFISTTLSLGHRWHMDDDHFLQIDLEWSLPNAKNETASSGLVTRSEALSSGAGTLTYGYLPEPDDLLEFQVEDRTLYSQSFSGAAATSSRTGVVTGIAAFLHFF